MATGQGPEPKGRSRYCGVSGAENVSAILLLVQLLYKCVQAAERARETETGDRVPQRREQPAKEGVSLPRRDGDSSGYNSEPAAGLSDLKFSLDRTAPPHLPLRAHQVALSYGSVR